MANPLTALNLTQLRQRRSVKWRRHDPDVLPLWVAEMDTPLAPPIAAALAEAISRGDTGYAHPGRLPEAYAAFAARRYPGWAPDPARMRLVPDVMRGITEVLGLVTRPGDGVLISTPSYPPFFSFVRGAGRQVVESPLARDAAGRYSLDLARLDRDLARPDVAAYLMCNPHNPTGLVLRRAELSEVIQLAQRHRVRLLVDEIHAPLTYPGAVHTPLASLPGEAADAAFTFASASKAWNLPGLKAALVVAAGDRAARDLADLPPEASFGAGLLGVIASEVALTEGEPWLAELIDGLDANRAHLADLLARHLPEVGYTMPEATYLAWLDCRRLGLGDDPAAAFLERGRVAFSPGPDFGEPGRGFVRLNLATSPQALAEGVRRMTATVAAAPIAPGAQRGAAPYPGHSRR